MPKILFCGSMWSACSTFPLVSNGCRFPLARPAVFSRLVLPLLAGCAGHQATRMSSCLLCVAPFFLRGFLCVLAAYFFSDPSDIFFFPRHRNHGSPCHVQAPVVVQHDLQHPPCVSCSLFFGSRFRLVLPFVYFFFSSSFFFVSADVGRLTNRSKTPGGRLTILYTKKQGTVPKFV